MSEPTIVTRFPPSPTGYLHIGGARTALFNWALARRHGGRFILRLEDTDRARSSEAAARSIIADLRWLGIDWDEGPTMPEHFSDVHQSDYDPYESQTGPNGPYAQSRRLDIYAEHLQTLRRKDLVYDDEGAVRFRMPGEDIRFKDMVRGEVTTAAGQLDDFVIMKSDGYPTYHFAVVVDDAMMGVNTIIRGQDHLTNTPKHIALQRALGFDQPAYAHMSLTTNPDGSKLGKRDKARVARKAARDHMARESVDVEPFIEALLGRQDELRQLHATHGGHPAGEPVDGPTIADFLDKNNDDVAVAKLIGFYLNIDLPEIDVRDFYQTGYLPQTLVNYLGLLGWNPGGDVEDFGDSPLSFLKEQFDPARFIKGNATFDRQKLLAFNGNRIRSMAPADWHELLWESPRTRQKLKNNPLFDGPNDRRFILFAEAYQQRCGVPGDALEQGTFFFTDDDRLEWDEKAVRKVLAKNDDAGWAMLDKLHEALKNIDPDDWNTDRLEQFVKDFAEAQQTKMGNVAQPIRVAVSGSTVSPPIGITLEILGRNRTLKRIDRCLQQR
jgi:glutamyl-tRNA synthetase